MNKLIDADKLIAEIERRKQNIAVELGDISQVDWKNPRNIQRGTEAATYDIILKVINSLLQQKQTEEIENNRIDAALIGFYLACENGDKTIGECIKFWKPIIITSLQQEQPVVDREGNERKIMEYWKEFFSSDIKFSLFKEIYELALNSRKEEIK